MIVSYSNYGIFVEYKAIFIRFHPNNMTGINKRDSDSRSRGANPR